MTQTFIVADICAHIRKLRLKREYFVFTPFFSASEDRNLHVDFAAQAVHTAVSRRKKFGNAFLIGKARYDTDDGNGVVFRELHAFLQLAFAYRFFFKRGFVVVYGDERIRFRIPHIFIDSV